MQNTTIELYSKDAFKHQEYQLLRLIPKGLMDILVKNGVIIAGGSVSSVFSGMPINAYDLYCPSSLAYNSLLKDFREYIKKTDLKGNALGAEVFITENAVTFRCDGKMYQVIQTHLRQESPVSRLTAEDIIKGFDFTICMGAYNTVTHQFSLHNQFLEHIARRVLMFNPDSKYPICALGRVKKYVKKGYHISGAEIVKMALCVANLEMKDYTDLKYQLLGIDTYIFADLTEDLIEKHGKDAKIDYGVVMEMIEYSLDKLNDIEMVWQKQMESAEESGDVFE